MSQERNRAKEARTNAARRKKKRQKLMMRRALFLAIAICLVVAIIALVINVIGKLSVKGADASTLTLTENGTVICEEVSPFDRDSYKESELKSFAKELIDSFNNTNGKTVVVLDEVKVKKNTAYVKTTFDSMEDYSMFSSYPAYEAKIDTAMEDGYSFAGNFALVDGGKKVEVIDNFKPSEYTGYYMVVIEENINVKVPGTICFVSDKNTTLVGEDTVVIAQPDGNSDAVDTVYIIYSK